MTAVMSSAILAAPGESTGELLVGYPFTSVSTSSTEVVKIQLRVYMGAVLKRPEQVIIMRDVFFEGLSEGHRLAVLSGEMAAEETAADQWINKEPGDREDLVYLQIPQAYLDTHSVISYDDFTAESIFRDYAPMNATNAQYGLFNSMWETHIQLAVLGIMKGGTVDVETMDRQHVPHRVYKGRCKTVPINGAPTDHANNGHLGVLDDPSAADRLFGTFAYNPTPNPN